MSLGRHAAVPDATVYFPLPGLLFPNDHILSFVDHLTFVAA